MRWVLLVLLCALAATNASAAGFGLYVGTAPEVGRFDIRADPGTEWNFSGGLLIDSNVARNRLFNYRLALGYQYTYLDLNPPFLGFEGDEGHGLSINQSFGFGLVRSRRFRIWAGPALRIAGSHHSGQWRLDPWLPGGYIRVSMPAYLTIQVGIGPELGINLHTGKFGSITLSGGYQVTYDLKIWTTGRSTRDLRGHTLSSGAHIVFANLGFLFRTPGDVF
jgi:hypothetical protein